MFALIDSVVNSMVARLPGKSDSRLEFRRMLRVNGEDDAGPAPVSSGLVSHMSFGIW